MDILNHKTHVRQCLHWKQAVPVGNKFIYCSALYDKLYASDGDVCPDLGVYLDEQWISNGKGMLWSNSVRIDTVVEYPILLCKWRDVGMVPPHIIDKLVNVIVDRIHKGQAVDIGCIGGHGRTGTLLACCIAKVEGLEDYRGAIGRVWERYCGKAVESKAQFEGVRDYVERQKKFKEMGQHTWMAHDKRATKGQ